MKIQNINHRPPFRRFLAVAATSNLFLVASASGQFSISSHTIDGGGGTSSGGSFSLTGTIGQPEASPIPATGGSFALSGGFWGAEASTTGGFAAWAAATIPGGLNASFAADADGNGIPNGIEYSFGGLPLEYFGSGSQSAPSNVPADVILRWTFSSDLVGWETRVEWTNGTPNILSGQVTIDNGQISDTHPGTDGKAYWRFEAILQTL